VHKAAAGGPNVDRADLEVVLERRGREREHDVRHVLELHDGDNGRLGKVAHKKLGRPAPARERKG